MAAPNLNEKPLQLRTEVVLSSLFFEWYMSCFLISLVHQSRTQELRLVRLKPVIRILKLVKPPLTEIPPC